MAKGSGSTKSISASGASATRTSAPANGGNSMTSASVESWVLSSTEKRRLNNIPSEENQKQIKAYRNSIPTLLTSTPFDNDIKEGVARRATPQTIVKHLNQKKNSITESYDKGVKTLQKKEKDAISSGNTMLAAFIKKDRILLREKYRGSMQVLDSRISKAKKLKSI